MLLLLSNQSNKLRTLEELKRRALEREVEDKDKMVGPGQESNGENGPRNLTQPSIR